MPLTQAQLVTAVAERAELSKSEAKRSLTTLEDIVLEELGNAQKVRLGGLVQLAVRVKPAQQARAGRNPATGEEIKIAGEAVDRLPGPPTAGERRGDPPDPLANRAAAVAKAGCGPRPVAWIRRASLVMCETAWAQSPESVG